MSTKKLIPLFITLLFIMTCSDNPVEPKHGSRNYIWTQDTIKTSNTLMRMWGSSPNDMWTISSGLKNSIYHYDGISWTTDDVFRIVSPYSIWGVSNDDVYIGGLMGKIWHFDGNVWSESATLTKDGRTDIVFDNMWGTSNRDFYATGAYVDEDGLLNNSVIAHFKDSNWIMYNTNEIRGIVESIFIDQNDKQVYLQAIKLSNTFDSTFIYQYNNSKYLKLYSTIWDNKWANIQLIDNEVFFVLRDIVAKRKNNKFVTILDLSNENFRTKIFGRNENDIFIEMNDGLAHYNGTDIEYLFQFDKPYTAIFRAQLFENDVFFLIFESQTNLSIIWHGILAED